jgi:hypothetical protein
VSLQGIANAASAAGVANPVSDGAVVSVREALLGGIQQRAQVAAELTKTAPGMLEAADARKPVVSPRQMLILHQHATLAQEKDRRQRIRYLLVGVGAFAFGYFMTQSGKGTHHGNRAARDFGSGNGRRGRANPGHGTRARDGRRVTLSFE